MGERDRLAAARERRIQPREIRQLEPQAAQRQRQRRLRPLRQHGLDAHLLQAAVQLGRADRLQHLHRRDVERLRQRHAHADRAMPALVEVLRHVQRRSGPAGPRSASRDGRGRPRRPGHTPAASGWSPASAPPRSYPPRRSGHRRDSRATPHARSPRPCDDPPPSAPTTAARPCRRPARAPAARGSIAPARPASGGARGAPCSAPPRHRPDAAPASGTRAARSACGRPWRARHRRR